MNAFTIAVLIAIGMFFLILAIFMWLFRDQRRVLKRISQMTTLHKNDAAILSRREAKKNKKTNSQIKVSERLTNDLLMSGMLIRPSEFLIIWILAALGPASILLLLSHSIVVALGAIIIGAFLPLFYVRHKRIKRSILFEKQLADALGIICSSLKAGLTFQQALVSISDEMPDPISAEFRRVARELNLGITIENSLTSLSEKLKSDNFSMVVSAILIQRQTGGNLSEILTNIAGTIKERFKIKNEIKVLTATARISGMIVGMMPVFILLIFMLINPSFITIFFNSNLGITMMVVGVCMEIIGFLFIRKIANIKF
ncbi:type II secretion system F family protein [Acetobacterium sp.]|uniref:type II secretion system F family protein n=1 Tax=Acetobacterium sp. TaxID=1872094 RepID=UPI002F401289